MLTLLTKIEILPIFHGQRLRLKPWLPAQLLCAYYSQLTLSHFVASNRHHCIAVLIVGVNFQLFVIWSSTFQMASARNLD